MSLSSVSVRICSVPGLLCDIAVLYYYVCVGGGGGGRKEKMMIPLSVYMEIVTNNTQLSMLFYRPLVVELERLIL